MERSERGDVAELKEQPSGLPLSSCVTLRPAPPTSEHVLAEQYDQHGLPVSWYGGHIVTGDDVS